MPNSSGSPCSGQYPQSSGRAVRNKLSFGQGSHHNKAGLCVAALVMINGGLMKCQCSSQVVCSGQVVCLHCWLLLSVAPTCCCSDDLKDTLDMLHRLKHCCRAALSCCTSKAWAIQLPTVRAMVGSTCSRDFGRQVIKECNARLLSPQQSKASDKLSKQVCSHSEQAAQLQLKVLIH